MIKTIDKYDYHSFSKELFPGNCIESVVSDEILKRMIISETCRLAINSIPLHPTLNNRVIHINKLKNWVNKKLRSIIPEIQSGEENIILDILREGDGPTLEFTGDLQLLPNGYYSTVPTRVINISNDKWIIISSIPTYKLIDMGYDVNVYDLTRRIRISEDNIRKNNIPIQNRYNYTGMDKYIAINDAFINNIDSYFEVLKWAPPANSQIYIGNTGKWNFKWEDTNVPISALINNKSISFWMNISEEGIKRYFLKIQKGSNIQQVVIPAMYFKQVCLYFDYKKDNPRVIYCKDYVDYITISSNFSFPAPQTRWLNAIGAEWLGYDNQRINWSIPKEFWNSTKDIITKLPIRIEWG